MRDEILDDLVRRARTAVGLGAVIVLTSTLAYYLTGCVVGMNARYGKDLWDTSDDRWEWTECLYAAGITVTAVGYTDVLGTATCEVWRDDTGRHRWVSATDAHADPGYVRASERLVADYSPWLRVMTVLQSMTGMAFFLFVIAQATSFFVEGGHGRLMWALRTRRQIRRLEQHVVVCGAGEAAKQAVRRLRAVDVPCAVIESDPEALRVVRENHPDVPCVLGDARDEEALEHVRVEHARAVLALLPDDGANMVSIVSVRELAPDVPITSRGVEDFSEMRLQAAGANTVVRLDDLVGLHAASRLCRPGTIGFLEPILRGEEDLHLRSLIVGAGVAGKTLGDVDLRHRSGLTALAHRKFDGACFSYNPGPEEVLEEGDELVVLGPVPQIERALEAMRRLDETGSRSWEAAPRPEAVVGACPYDSTERSDHYIVCGAGHVGEAAARELKASGRRFVILDASREHCAELRGEFGEERLLEGDAQDPELLVAAGIETARGLITLLPDDQQNLVVVVTARTMRPNVRILGVARQQRAARRLGHAGAEVIPLGRVAGTRAAADVLRPHVATFLDRMRREEVPHRFEGVGVRQGAPLAGLALREAPIYRRTGLRVVAMRAPGETRFVANPGPDEKLLPGTLVLVIGTPHQVQALADLVGDWE